MKPEEIRRMTLDQLDDEALKLKKEQFNLRFQRATGQLENTSRVRVVRRDIARILTIARQKRAGDEPKLAAAPAKPKQAKTEGAKTEGAKTEGAKTEGAKTEGSKPARAKPKATAKRRAPVKSRSKPNPKSRAKAKKSKK